MGTIRFFLAVAVVIAHTSSVFGFGLVGGEMAVKLFFMISGFYMALILNEKYVGVNGSFWLFFKNRLLRLYPLYFLILIATILITYFGYQFRPDIESAYSHFLTYGNQLTPGSWAYLVSTNGIMLGMDTSLFLEFSSSGALNFTKDFHASNPKLYSFLYIPQAWSISIELMFYLIAPFIVRNLNLLILLLLLSLGLSITLEVLDFPSDPWNYRFFPSQLMFFILGSGGYLIYKRMQNKQVQVSQTLKYGLFIVVLLITLLYSFLEEVIDPFSLSVLTVAIYAVSIPVIFDLSKMWKKDRFVGELSYSIYMVHILVIYAIKLTGITHLFIFGLSELVVGSTIIASILIQKIFLEKIERFRQI